MSSRKHELKNGIFFIVVGVCLIGNGLRRIRLRRKIDDMPLSRLRSAQQGLVEIQGFVWPCKNATVATTKGRRAVWRTLEVKRRMGRIQSTILTNTFTPLFLVTDGTSVAALDASKAEMSVEQSTTDWEKLGTNEQAMVNALMRSNGDSEIPKWRIPFLGAHYSVNEAVILPGSPIYVCGAFTKPAHPLILEAEKGLPEFEDTVRALDLDKRPPKHWDKNRDGKLSASEAREGLYRLSTRLPPKAPGDNLKIKCAGILKTDKTHTLLIADCHEWHLRRAMSHTTSLLQIVGGLICLGVGVFLILYYLQRKEYLLLF